jgi:hypothetical protein
VDKASFDAIMEDRFSILPQGEEEGGDMVSEHRWQLYYGTYPVNILKVVDHGW